MSDNGLQTLIERVGGLEQVIFRHTAAPVSTFQPSNNAFLPGGIAYQQQPFIGEYLLPSVSASPDGTRKASYWTFGQEALFASTTRIGQYGEYPRADIGLTQRDITLQDYGMSAWIEPFERSAAAAVGLNIDTEKAKVIRGQVDVGREAMAATLLTTTSNYASASHYETLSGTNQWSHSSSDPLGAVNAKIEALRAILGQRPNVLWMSPTAANALRLHPNIVKYVNGGTTRQNPAIPISLEMIGSILGLRIYVGESIAATTPGGSVSDVWNDCAGLLYVGGTGMYDLKFGCTLVSAGYPKQRVERDPHRGLSGIDVLYYADCYTHAVQLSTAGYLWSDVTA